MGRGLKEFFIDSLARLVVSDGMLVTEIPEAEGLTEARRGICESCTHVGWVKPLKNPLIKARGCTVCSCPLRSKCRTLIHRDFREGIEVDWESGDVPGLLDRLGIKKVRTTCPKGKWREVDLKYLGVKNLIAINMKVIKNIREFGKVISNPHQIEGSYMRDVKCACDGKSACGDKLTIPENGTVKSFVFNGKTYTVPEGADWKDYMCEIIMKYELDVYLEVEPTYIEHIGGLTLGSVVLSDDTPVEGQRSCTVIKECKSLANLPKANAKDLVITETKEDGTTVNHTVPGDHTAGGEAGATSLANSINGIADLDATATVTCELSGAYAVTLTSSSGSTYSFPDRPFEDCGCEQKFLYGEEKKAKK